MGEAGEGSLGPLPQVDGFTDPRTTSRFGLGVTKWTKDKAGLGAVRRRGSGSGGGTPASRTADPPFYVPRRAIVRPLGPLGHLLSRDDSGSPEEGAQRRPGRNGKPPSTGSTRTRPGECPRRCRRIRTKGLTVTGSLRVRTKEVRLNPLVENREPLRHFLIRIYGYPFVTLSLRSAHGPRDASPSPARSTILRLRGG